MQEDVKPKKDRKEYLKQWKKDHPQYGKEWIKNNPEGYKQQKETNKKWRKKNKDKLSEYYKKWRLKNLEKRREYDRQWRLDHLDQRKLNESNRRRYVLIGVPKHIRERIKNKVFTNDGCDCPMCGTWIDNPDRLFLGATDPNETTTAKVYCCNCKTHLMVTRKQKVLYQADIIH